MGYALSLYDLRLAENKIADLSPLSNLTNLETIYAGNNQISNLSPLIDFTALGTLDLSGNQITDISPLSALTGMAWLCLDNNQITNLDPLVDSAGIGDGDSVRIEDNSYDCEDQGVLDDIDTLIERGVSLHHDC